LIRTPIRGGGSTPGSGPSMQIERPGFGVIKQYEVDDIKSKKGSKSRRTSRLTRKAMVIFNSGWFQVR
jgi:hypothetical protein